jgi:hypothetical protein
MIIDGGGLVTIDGGHATRLFNVTSWAVNVTFQNITLQNGGYSPTNPPLLTSGGALDTVAYEGAAIAYNQSGGGPTITGAYGTLSLINVKVLNNSITSYDGIDDGGGAVHMKDGILVVANSDFESNSGSYGGALTLLHGIKLVVMNSTFNKNIATGKAKIPSSLGAYSKDQGDNAGKGGAINVDTSGSVAEQIFCNNVFSGNTAVTGIDPSNRSWGGALFLNIDNSEGQQNILVNNTFSNNKSAQVGGAIWTNLDTTIWNDTYTGNTSIHGGAFSQQAEDILIANTTFTGNTNSPQVGSLIPYGAAFDIEHVASALISNCSFASNISAWVAGMYFSTDDKDLSFYPNSFLGNTGANYYGVTLPSSDVLTTSSPGTGAIQSGTRGYKSPGSTVTPPTPTPTPSATHTATSTGTTLTGSEFMIRTEKVSATASNGISGNYGFCLNIAGGSQSAGTAVILYPCTTSDVTKAKSNEVFQWNTAKGLTAYGTMCIVPTSSNGLELEKCDGSAGQVWEYSGSTGSESTDLTLLNPTTGKVIDIPGGTIHSGGITTLEVYSPNGGTNQRWSGPSVN